MASVNSTHIGNEGINNSTSFLTKDTKLGYSNGDAVDNTEGNNLVNGSGSETKVATNIGSKNPVFINPPSTGPLYENS